MKSHMSHFHDELFLHLPCLSKQLKEGEFMSRVNTQVPTQLRPFVGTLP